MKKSLKNYYIDILAFVPFLLLLISGIIMLAYHNGKPPSEEIGAFSGYKWRNIHKILTIIALPLVLIHVALHFTWVKKLFTFKLKGKHKGVNITLFILFLLCAFSALFSWLVFAHHEIGNVLRGLHSKFGLLLIIFFVIHIFNYIQWLVAMTRKAIGK